MYTLEKVLELVNAGSDIYCVLFRYGRACGEGWLSDLDLDSHRRIESYRLETDDEGDYLVLMEA